MKLKTTVDVLTAALVDVGFNTPDPDPALVAALEQRLRAEQQRTRKVAATTSRAGTDPRIVAEALRLLEQYRRRGITWDAAYRRAAEELSRPGRVIRAVVKPATIRTWRRRIGST